MKRPKPKEKGRVQSHKTKADVEGIKKTQGDRGKCLRRGHMENVAYKGRRKKAAGKSRRKRHDQNIK